MAVYDEDHKGYRVFVGDLGTKVFKYELEKEFEYYGEVKDVWLARNPPGFAFIVFKFEEDANNAVRKLNGRIVCRRRVRVEHALPYGEKRFPNREPPRRSSWSTSKPRYRSRSHERRRDRSRSRSRSHDTKRRRSLSRSRSHSRHRSTERRGHLSTTAKRSSSTKSKKRSGSSRSTSRSRRHREGKREKSGSRSHDRRHDNSHSASHRRSEEVSPKGVNGKCCDKENGEKEIAAVDCGSHNGRQSDSKEDRSPGSASQTSPGGEPEEVDSAMEVNTEQSAPRSQGGKMKLGVANGQDGGGRGAASWSSSEDESSTVGKTKVSSQNDLQEVVNGCTEAGDEVKNWGESIRGAKERNMGEGEGTRSDSAPTEAQTHSETCRNTNT